MTTFAAIAVTIALNCLAYALHLAGDRWVHVRSEIVLHGISSGIPVSIEHRRMVLTHGFVAQAIVGIGFFAVVAVGFYGLSASTSDPLVETLGLISAFAWGFMCLGWVAFGVVWFWYLLSVLRRAAQGSQ
jgi:hypothetical protein